MSEQIISDKSAIVERASTYRTATIANGASLSGELDIKDFVNGAIRMPSSWTAANLTFQGSEETGGTFEDIYDDSGNEATVTAAASRCLLLPAAVMAWRYIKIRSGTSATPVNQGAERSLVLVLKG
jgi:hypothetical protein